MYCIVVTIIGYDPVYMPGLTRILDGKTFSTEEEATDYMNAHTINGRLRKRRSTECYVVKYNDIGAYGVLECPSD